jgi:hypothetical protein
MLQNFVRNFAENLLESFVSPNFATTLYLASTYIILEVRFAACDEYVAAGLVVPVLAGEVEGGEPAPVLDVHVAPLPAEQVHRPAEPLPGRLMQGCVPVL